MNLRQNMKLRSAIEMTDNYEVYYNLWKDKKITAREAAEICNIPLWAFYQKGYKKE